MTQRRDGVEDAPGKTGGDGESAGGAYPNPHTGKKGPGEGGFTGHGGQSDIAYSGTGSGEDEGVGNANAVTE